MRLYNTLASFSIIFPAILALIYYRKHFSLKLVSIYILNGLAFEMAFFYTSYRHMHNWWLYDIYIFAELLLLGLWLGLQFRNVILWCLLALSMLVLLAITIMKPVNTVYNLRFENAVLFISLGAYLIWLMRQYTLHPIWQDARLWIAAGLFMYFAVLSLTNTLTTFLLKPGEERAATYYVYMLASMNLLSYIIYCKAYLCKYPIAPSYSQVPS